MALNSSTIHNKVPEFRAVLSSNLRTGLSTRIDAQRLRFATDRTERQFDRHAPPLEVSSLPVLESVFSSRGRTRRMELEALITVTSHGSISDFESLPEMDVDGMLMAPAFRVPSARWPLHRTIGVGLQQPFILGPQEDAVHVQSETLTAYATWVLSGGAHSAAEIADYFDLRDSDGPWLATRVGREVPTMAQRRDALRSIAAALMLNQRCTVVCDCGAQRTVGTLDGRRRAVRKHRDCHAHFIATLAVDAVMQAEDLPLSHSTSEMRQRRRALEFGQRLSRLLER